MMLVKILEFGSNWWARFGRDPQDRYRFTRHAAYSQLRGRALRTRRCGGYWIVPGSDPVQRRRATAILSSRTALSAIPSMR